MEARKRGESHPAGSKSGTNWRIEKRYYMVVVVKDRTAGIRGVRGRHLYSCFVLGRVRGFVKRARHWDLGGRISVMVRNLRFLLWIF